MKARDLVGRRIVAVRQERVYRNGHGRDQLYNLASIRLDNGAIVTFTVAELGHDYAVEATVHKPERSTPPCGRGLTHEIGVCECSPKEKGNG